MELRQFVSDSPGRSEELTLVLLIKFSTKRATLRFIMEELKHLVWSDEHRDARRETGVAV